MTITPRARTDKHGVTTFNVPFRLDGRQTSETFPTDVGAQRFAKLIDQLGPAGAVAILAQRATSTTLLPTLTDWCLEYIDELIVEEGTRRTYRAYVRNDLGTLGPLPLDALTEKAVGKWVRGMLEGIPDRGVNGAAEHTIKNKHGFLSGALSGAVKAGHIPGNPCRGVRLPTTENEEMTFLTGSEYATFLGYFPPRWQPLVTCLVSTGLRWSEATALQVRDIDLDAGTLRVSRAWKATMGEGHRIGPPKSKMSKRTIALAPETVELLRPLVQGRPASTQRAADEWPGASPWVFTNSKDGPVRARAFSADVWLPSVRLANGEPARGVKIGPDGKPKLGQRVTRRVDASGNLIVPAKVPLGKRPHPHDLRHTCASWLLFAGVDIFTVSRHLGHEKITTTTTSYGHLMPGSRTAVSNALSLALTAAHPVVEPDEDEDLDDDEPLQIEA